MSKSINIPSIHIVWAIILIVGVYFSYQYGLNQTPIAPTKNTVINIPGLTNNQTGQIAIASTSCDVALNPNACEDKIRQNYMQTINLVDSAGEAKYNDLMNRCKQVITQAFNAARVPTPVIQVPQYHSTHCSVTPGALGGGYVNCTEY